MLPLIRPDQTLHVVGPDDEDHVVTLPTRRPQRAPGNPGRAYRPSDLGVNADGTYSKSLGEQARRSLAIVRAAIEALGGKIEHVIRTRMYVTDVTKWEEVAKVHGEVFADVRPVSTLVEVKGLLEPWMQVEIEADAFVTPK